MIPVSMHCKSTQVSPKEDARYSRITKISDKVSLYLLMVYFPQNTRLLTSSRRKSTAFFFTIVYSKSHSKPLPLLSLFWHLYTTCLANQLLIPNLPCPLISKQFKSNLQITIRWDIYFISKTLPNPSKPAWRT